MTQEISSLMDGEQEPRGTTLDAAAMQRWDEYHLIGDVMRGDSGKTSRVAERVRAALEKEPTVLSPRVVSRRPGSVGRVALAAAASVATVGVVAWMGMQQGGDSSAPAPTLAVAPAAIQAPVAAPASRTVRPAVPAPDPHDYLVAHRQIPSAEFYRPVAARQP